MPNDTVTQCQILQEEEYQVLESIFPEFLSRETSAIDFRLEIPIELDNSQEILMVNDRLGKEQPLTFPGQRLSLASLPPLLLHIMLPVNYPLEVPPSIISVRSTHSWLLRSDQLRLALNEMWTVGQCVLYDWIEYIRTGAFMGNLSMVSDNIIEISHPTPQHLSTLLKNHDLSMKQENFLQTSYSCSVCLGQYKGAKCAKLSCGHVFCRSCLLDFWGLCITEGDVDRVKCPDPECVKATSQATEADVARIVSQSELVRWRWLREKLSLERDPHVIYCPIPSCQTPVPRPTIPEDDESGWSRLRTCQTCSFSFCSFCKRTWHGPLSSCPISVTESMVLEYLSLPTGSPERDRIEKRYGRVMLSRLVAKHEEEQLNKKWLDASTVACPGCNVNVEKSLGCNHMTCAKCKQHFCYRCGTKLNPSNPYPHFSTSGQQCYNKLFDFMEEDDNGWQPIEGFDLL